MTITSGLKNVNMLTKEQYDGISELAVDELYAVSGSGIDMPSNRHINLTPGASGATYTAPANGWFAVLQIQSNTGYCNLYSNSVIGFMYYGIAETSLKASIPVKKGDIVTYGYSNVSSIEYLIFIYAEGE